MLIKKEFLFKWWINLKNFVFNRAYYRIERLTLNFEKFLSLIWIKLWKIILKYS